MATTNGKEETEEKVAEIDVNELRREAFAKADEIRSEAAKKLNVAAEAIRKEVRDKEADAEAVEKADEVATHLEKTATYLDDHTVEEMTDDATTVVVENPWRAVLMALVIGIILGLILRRK